MSLSSPKLIVLEFYDGPTEGFVRRVEYGLVYYFRTVAWDAQQDRRLYLLGIVDESVFVKLLGLLNERNPMMGKVVLTPIWEFDNSEQEIQANKLIEESQRTLNSPDLVVLGTSLLEDFEVLNPNEAQLRLAISLAQSGVRINLEEWFSLDYLA